MYPTCTATCELGQGTLGPRGGRGHHCSGLAGLSGAHCWAGTGCWAWDDEGRDGLGVAGPCHCHCHALSCLAWTGGCRRVALTTPMTDHLSLVESPDSSSQFSHTRNSKPSPNIPSLQASCRVRRERTRKRATASRSVTLSFFFSTLSLFSPSQSPPSFLHGNTPQLSFAVYPLRPLVVACPPSLARLSSSITT